MDFIPGTTRLSYENVVTPRIIFDLVRVEGRWLVLKDEEGREKYESKSLVAEDLARGNLMGWQVVKSDDVAKTILDQLGGVGRLQSMTGAKDILFDSNSVQFKFKNRTGPNYCKVTLDPDDTYTVEFGRFVTGRLVKKNLQNIVEFEGMFASQLISLFEVETGLALSL